MCYNIDVILARGLHPKVKTIKGEKKVDNSGCFTIIIKTI